MNVRVSANFSNIRLHCQLQVQKCYLRILVINPLFSIFMTLIISHTLAQVILNPADLNLPQTISDHVQVAPFSPVGRLDEVHSQ